jgi:two-component system, chemotaxis family, CheB/CheR fusion protein
MKTDTNGTKRKQTTTTKTKEQPFTVVAIGASVGGLEAVSEFLRNLPPDTGMAFIYVQHLNPDHKSLLTSILSKITKMQVQEVENMEHIAPNNVYVIPTNKIIEVTDGHIKLLNRPKNSSTISIDVLFSSLAQTHKENVIGIILSGNATDGTIGLKAIKDAGGLTFAQDDSAQASSMPHSAIAEGIVDFVLSPAEIAKELTYLSQNGFKKRLLKHEYSDGGAENSNSDLNTIFELLRKETGVDFSHYKMATIKRRLSHNMQECGVKTVKAYIDVLISNKNNEINLLYKDLLINVTSFFRDTEAFQYLKATLFPAFLESKTVSETLRIWVTACSTGEEAYSIAMILDELQEKKDKKIHIQIFATDLSEDAIRTARLGEYDQTDLKSIAPKYINRYFTKVGDRYRVVKELREMCVFAPHNILRDPPFSRMDFVSCCNLLIYFDAAAQKKVFTTLHFALTEGGYLMLGKAETAGTSSQLFSQVNNKLKIYSRKKNVGVRRIIELLPRFPRTIMSNKKTITTTTKNINTNPAGIESAIDAVLLSSYMPACAVINKDMEVIQFRGPISLFLEHPSGKASLNILKMARSEFAFELRNAINKTLKTKEIVYKSGIEIKIASVLSIISFEVSMLKIEWDEPLLLIVFKIHEQVEKYVDNDKSGKTTASLKDQKINKLTEELYNIRLEINTITELQEITFEELQAANEEIVSSNEEYQTLNEELETSKEEIEVTNEELISTNQELQVRNDLLTESQEYSEAIIATIHEPMLILDKNFHVKSANKSFYEKFLVKKEDTEGHLLFNLGNKQWDITELKEALNHILSDNKSFENFEVKHSFSGIGEKIMLLNAHLIIQKVSSEQLILLAIQDITDSFRFYLKEKYSLSLIEASLDPLVTINTEGKITDMNEATVNITGLSRDILRGSDFFTYFTEAQKAREVYQEVFEKGSVANFPLTLRHKEGNLTDVLFNGSVYNDDKGNIQGAVIVARDITEQKRNETNLLQSLRDVSDYKYALDESSIVDVTDEKGVIKYINENYQKISQYTIDELKGKNHSFVNSGYHSKEFMRELWETISSGKIWKNEIKNKAKDGTFYWVATTIVPFLNEEKKPYQYVAISIDITEQKRIASELIEAKVFAEVARGIAETEQDKAENAMKAKQQFLSNMSHEIRTPLNGIIGFTKVVLKTDLTAKQKEYLTAIKMSGDALIVLINDILDLAKVDAGKMTFEQTPFKLAASISSMLHLFDTKIQEKNLTLIKEYDKNIPEVLVGDPIRLHQIILNLVSNAVKFTTKGYITVSVRLLHEDEEKVNIEFAVTDTGIGIPEDKTEAIFENFQQASNETSRVYGGTGLGLAIAKQLVESQGGSIKVKSVADKGSTFSFVLSFQKTDEDVELAPEILELYKDVKNVKVLVVEDMALNQLLMKTILDDYGFERDIAENGLIAIEKIKEKEYDVILMDLQMPEMNGFEATDYIRNTLKSSVPIIALTADVTTVDLAKCKAVGMNDYIAKPVDERVLYSKIIGLVKKPTLVSLDVEKPIIEKKSKYTNLNYLMLRTKSNPLLMSEMIQAYLEQTPTLINSMKKSFQDKNWQMLHAAVHKMLPSFLIMGISTDFERMAKKVMEYAQTQEQTEDIVNFVLQLETVCVQACEELKEELDVIKNAKL